MRRDPSATGPSAVLAGFLISVATDVASQRDALNRLDGVAGDGDLGLTVAGAAAALETGEAIRRAGSEIARRAPSTGGTLIAFAMMAAGRTDVTMEPTPSATAAAYVEAAVQAIASRGKVAPGDKTMLDALQPAAAALRRSASDGATLATAFADAAAAADGGARRTATMPATVGRAAWLAERSMGHEDAGARLVALVFASAARRLAALDR